MDGNPKYPPYLANIGRRLLLDGREGAESFLQRLTDHRRIHPEAVNDHVTVIEAECLAKTGLGDAASRLRRARIDAGSGHPALYTAEAEYLISCDLLEEATRLLDLAKKRRASDDYTESIRARVLEEQGCGEEASRLRRARIEAWSDNAAIYNAEAAYLLDHGTPHEAWRMLVLAKQRGAVDGKTSSIRAKVRAMIPRTPTR